MSVHVYPRRAALADLARAGIGMTLSGVPLAIVPTPAAVDAALLAMASVFLALACRATRLIFTRVEMNQEGLRVRTPRPLRLDWQTLRRVNLAYYSTRGDRSGGWLQLTLSGDGARLAVGSRLNEFARLAERAAAVARINRLPLDPATRANFLALGIDPGPFLPTEVGR